MGSLIISWSKGCLTSNSGLRPVRGLFDTEYNGTLLSGVHSQSALVVC